MTGARADWAVKLFNRSVLKQAKYRELLAALDDPAGKRNLDIGADNGVISYLLRQRGGEWWSADLDEHTVTSIRRLVETNVHRIDGGRTPFADGQFDQVVVVDFLEHIPDDRGFAAELARILKPGGTVLINVPHLKRRSLLNAIRHRVGLTDAWHGHLRPGYTVEGLRDLLGPRFRIERARTYSRAFSEGIDTVLNGLYVALQRRKSGPSESRKGTVVTQDDWAKHRKEFRMLSALYPFLWATSRLDAALPLQAGYKLIVKARLTSSR